MRRGAYTLGQTCRHQDTEQLNPWQNKLLPLEDFSVRVCFFVSLLPVVVPHLSSSPTTA
eukprot:COSAG02_NODE_47181_length_343_cov_0.635246_1_plen_58_part_10